MKQIFLICFLLTLTVLCFGQKIYKLNKVPHVFQGKVMLIDGTMFHFTNLEVRNDTVIFTDPQSNECKYPGGEVYKISRPGTYATAGALISGSVGLVAAFSIISNFNNTNMEGRGNTGYIVGITAAFAAIGGLVGAFINREKTIYKNNSAFSFGLDNDSFIVNEPTVMLSFKIKL